MEKCWFYAIWMNIHFLAAIILRMPKNLSVSFFFTDYVFPSYLLMIQEFHLIDLHFYLIILELGITCLVMFSFMSIFYCRVPIIVYIAERAKKCLDFCSSVFIIHLLICCYFDVQIQIINQFQGIPLNLYWWGTMIFCMVSMTLLCLCYPCYMTNR